MTEFQKPEHSLGDLDATAVAALISAAGDIALIIDSSGLVVDIALHNDALAQDMPDGASWIGQSWAACAMPDSRSKIESLLVAAHRKESLRQIHVNHPGRGTQDLPIQYTVLPMGHAGRLVALGQDLRKQSILQQRLVDAQQSMERDYLALRHIETRYRLLFEKTSDALLILDGASQKTMEANPAARGLLGNGKPLTGRPIQAFFDPLSAQAVATLLTMVRTAGRADDIRALLTDRSEVTVSASVFRQESSSMFLVQVTPLGFDPAIQPPSAAKAMLLLAAEFAPDGIVITGSDGRIVTANAAFLDMVQLASEEQLKGTPLDQWLGRSGVDLGVLTAKLVQWRSVRLFATTLRGAYGSSTDVEISAVSVQHDGKCWYGFSIRDVGRRLTVDSRVGRDMPRSVDQLNELIGRVPLKELVREATDMIERLCIETALEMTGDNRASAAELLGLSRQSLYLKLRRHGLGDLGPESDKSE